MNWKEFLYPYEQVVAELLVKFNSLNEEYVRRGMYSPIESVAGRVKSISSILEKAAKKNIPMNRIEYEIEDIAGIRILCPFVEDIEKVI
ncbi:MAG: GTP pyrophosphokinase, partial [Firmicutes bacterium]|nr:GTP pyrophosphokinase [Bacillota bacterium]